MLTLQDLRANANLLKRVTLEKNFSSGAVPTQADFYALIHNPISQGEDGLAKRKDTPLYLQVGAADGNGDREALLLYGSFIDSNPTPKFSISINDADDSTSFVTSGQKRLTIGQSGNVGIGTSTPGAPLVVSNSDKAQIQFNRVDASGAIEQNSNGGALRLQDTSNQTKIQLRTYGDSYFNGGNVGIGTTDPRAKLHVHSNIMVEDPSRDANNRKLAWMRTNFGDDDYGFKFSWRNDAEDTPRVDAIGLSHSGDVYFPGGRVGIGTTDPQEKLHVIGEVFAVNLRSSSNTIVGNNLTVNGQTIINDINLRGQTKEHGELTPGDRQGFKRLEVPSGKVVVGIEVKRDYIDDGDKDIYSFKLLYR